MSYRIMGYFGFVFGIGLGILARDTYLFTMADKMDMINKDYKEMENNILNKISKTKQDIKLMRARAYVLQTKYKGIKQRVLNGEQQQKFFIEGKAEISQSKK